MSRKFVSASSQYLGVTSTPLITGYPFTMSIWLNITTAFTGTIFAVSGNGVTDGYASMACLSDGTVRLQVNAQITPNSGATTLSTGTWYRITGVYNSAADRRLYVNNIKFTDTISENFPSGMDGYSIGALQYSSGSGSPAGFIDGEVSDAAIWSSALSDADVAMLSAGYAAISISPATLVNYWPLIGLSTETDIVGNKDLTNNGSTITDQPRLIYQRKPKRLNVGKRYQFAGNISESTDVTDWRITATDSATGTRIKSTKVTGSTYSLDIDTKEPYSLNISPHVDYRWTTGIGTAALNALCVPSNPDTNQLLLKCTTSGAVGGSEPTWNTTPGGTTADGSAVWTTVVALDNGLFQTLGVKVPS